MIALEKKKRKYQLLSGCPALSVFILFPWRDYVGY